jgi:hypothetical protein
MMIRAAADVGDRRSGGELRLDAVEGGNPVRDQLGYVAGAVEGVDADEDVLVVFVPADAGAGAEGFGQARFGA